MAKKREDHKLFFLGLVGIVAMAGITVMVLTSLGASFSVDDNLVGEAFAIKSDGFSKVDNLVDNPDQHEFDDVIPDWGIYLSGASSVLVDELKAGYILFVDANGVMHVFESTEPLACDVQAEQIAVEKVIDRGDLSEGFYVYEQGALSFLDEQCWNT